jgi:hypothetical protein
MGTSGAYGGSGRKAWEDARKLLDDLPLALDGDGKGEGNDVDGLPDGGDAQVAALAGALAIALTGDDITLRVPQTLLTLADLLPRRGTGGGGGGGGAIRAESSGSGRASGGSTRSITRSAARGGAVIGSAFALRSGNREALAEFGLDLDELRSLGPLTQCSRILDVVLGEGGHPDEMALRAAAAEQLKAIITMETPPTEADALRGFIAAFVFQIALVELRSDLAKGVIDPATSARKEGRLRRYIRQRASDLTVPATGTMSITDFSVQADRLVREAIALLGAR